MYLQSKELPVSTFFCAKKRVNVKRRKRSEKESISNNLNFHNDGYSSGRMRWCFRNTCNYT